MSILNRFHKMTGPMRLFVVLALFAMLPLFAMAQEDDGSRDRSSNSRRRRSEDISLLLISSGDVQRELDITPAQGELLEAIGEDLGAQGGRGRRGESAEDRRYRTELPRRLFQVVLDEDQSKRLAQIGFQFKGAFAIDDEQFAQAVSLNDEQIAVVKKARDEQPDIGYNRLQELLGSSTAQKWKTQMGKSFNFRGPLRQLRMAYLSQYPRRGERSRRRGEWRDD